MYFTTATTVAILAQAAAVLGAPTSSYSAPSSTYSAPVPTKTGGLSLTAQLTLADTAADRFALLPNNADFVFDFNTPQPNPGRGGQVGAANRKTFPALVGTGSAMAVGRIGACGMNTPHVHLRGTELLIVTQGRLVTEMVPENGVNNADGVTPRVVRNTLSSLQMTPFPQGSVHTQYNPDCGDVVFVASFNSEDPGTGQVANETFALSDNVVAASFGQAIRGADIDRVRHAIPKSIALGVEECLIKCNITRSTPY